MAAALLTRSSGLPSLPLVFLSCQLRTAPPWLLKAILYRSVSMTSVGSAFWGVAPTGRGAAATSASAEAAAAGGGAVASAAGWAPGFEGAPGVLWEAVCPAAPLLAAGGTCDLKK